MEGTFQKLGIYQTVSVLFAGMTAILFGMYLEIPQFYKGFVDNDALKEDGALKVLLFAVASYFFGIVLQEAGSWLDQKLFKFQDQYRGNHLNSEVWENPLEKKDFIKIANFILSKDEANETFTEDEQRYVFFQCKDYLEVRKMDSKATRIESMSSMCRSLMVAFPVLLAMFVWKLHSDASQSLFSNLPVIFLLAFLTVLCYIRAKKYAKMRFNAIFRHYKMAYEMAKERADAGSNTH